MKCHRNLITILKILYNIAFISAVGLLVVACGGADDSDLPETARGLDELTEYEAGQKPSNEISFKQKQEYGDTNEEVLDEVAGVAVDDSGRVFVGDAGQQLIHIYHADGSYLESMGRAGSGPGEFQTISNLMEIKGEQLLAYDQNTRLLHRFELDSFSFEQNFGQPSGEDLPGGFLHALIATGDEILVGIEESSVPDKQRFVRYYMMNPEGELVSDELFKLQTTTIYQHQGEESSVTMSLPFDTKPLVGVSSENEIYTAQTTDFLIKVYDQDGTYRRAIYYPIDKAALDSDAFIEEQPTPGIREAARGIDYPDHWPALDYMLIDDEDRLWVSTIVEDTDIYQWWILEKSGELITKFEWPRDEPIEKVKNGYMYTREKDEKDVESIVRYKIEME